MKFEELQVGMDILDNGKKESVLELTSNSVLITQTKRKESGINCTSWVAGKDIKDRLQKTNQ